MLLRWKADALLPTRPAKIQAKLPDTSRYLHRLGQRMAARGFSPDDPLFRKVVVAQATLSDLTLELHKLAYHGAYGPKHVCDGERRPR